MAKHKDYLIVKKLIEFGDIHSFSEIFENIPRSVVARDLGMNYARINKLINKVGRLMIDDISRLAELIEIDMEVLMNLILFQYNYKGKKSKK